MKIFSQKSKKNYRHGFTLIELLVAISIFAIVATMSMGAVVSVFNANKKSQTLKSAMDNFNFAIEDMTRTIRFGGTYHCGSFGGYTSPRNCSWGESFIAVSSGGSTVIYRLYQNKIQRSNDGGSNYTDVTSPNVVIERLRFYVFGSSISDNVQPRVHLVIKGYVGSKPSFQSSFDITTTVSQRSIDTNL